MDSFWHNCRFSFLHQIPQVRTCNNFQILNSHRMFMLCIKKAPNPAKDLINMVSVTLEGLRMVSDRIVDFRFFIKFHRSGSAIIFSFEHSQNMLVMHQKCPNQATDLINMVCVTLEGLWMVSNRIIYFQFFFKFLRSGPAIIFSFWTLTEHVSYESIKTLFKH